MFEQLSAEAYVYRHGRIVCDRALVTIVRDARLGLRAAEARRHVAVRFVNGIEAGLRGQLRAPLDTRGVRCARLAESLEPIELVVRDGRGERRVPCRLDRPTVRNGPLEEVDSGCAKPRAPQAGVAGREGLPGTARPASGACLLGTGMALRKAAAVALAMAPIATYRRGHVY